MPRDDLHALHFSDSVSSSLHSSCSNSPSEESASDTYYNDLGGPAIRPSEDEWAKCIPRTAVARVYQSSEEGDDARERALRFLNGTLAEVGEDVDDTLSFEELQTEADAVTAALDDVKLEGLVREIPNVISPHSPSHERPTQHRPTPMGRRTMMNVKRVRRMSINERSPRRRQRANDVLNTSMLTPPSPTMEANEEWEEDEFADLAIDIGEGDDSEMSVSAMRNLPQIPRNTERAASDGNDSDLEDELDGIPTMRRIPSPTSPPPRSKPHHRRIETLPDIPELPPELLTETKGQTSKPHHRRIETLPDLPEEIFGLADEPNNDRMYDMDDDIGSEIPKLPPLPSSLQDESTPQTDNLRPHHRRIDPPPDFPELHSPSRTPEPETSVNKSASKPPKFGHVVTLSDSPPNLKRILTLPDDDSPISQITPFKTMAKKTNGRSHSHLQKRDSLQDRIEKLTTELATLQMNSAGLAAEAELGLSRTTDAQRQDVYRLRITLDHLARMILERAYNVRDNEDACECK